MSEFLPATAVSRRALPQAARALKENAMQGLTSQLKLANAIRYLRERNRYVLDRPVAKLQTPPPILTRWVKERKERKAA